MKDLLVYYYLKNFTNGSPNEKQIKLINRFGLIDEYLDKYNFLLGDPKRDIVNSKIVIPLSSLEEQKIVGFIDMYEDKIYIEVDKMYLEDTLCVYEYLTIFDDEFEGNYTDFVWDNSGIQYTVGNRVLDKQGTPISTFFNSLGVVCEDNTTLPYSSVQDNDKLEEALEFHQLSCEEVEEEFYWGDYNVVSVKIYDPKEDDNIMYDEIAPKIKGSLSKYNNIRRRGKRR